MRRQIRRWLIRLGMIKDCTYDGVHLSLLNHRGSVEHYYHFMMGFILPLVQVWPDVVARAAGRQIYIRSCAVMDSLLHELQLEGVSILPPVTHKLLETNAEEFRKAGHRLEYKSALGFDKPAAYDAQVFFTTRAQVFDRLREEISSAKIAMEALFGAGGPRVLIIDRLPPNPLYNSEGSEVKGSGAERRSVENMDDMVEVANRYCAAVALISLEGRSLASQIALFSMADIVVAQHGAALANLLWADEGTNVIEILPDLRHLPDSDIPLYFLKLCDAMRLNHHLLKQPHSHSSVDLRDFAAILDSLLCKTR